MSVTRSPYHNCLGEWAVASRSLRLYEEVLGRHLCSLGSPQAGSQGKARNMFRPEAAAPSWTQELSRDPLRSEEMGKPGLRAGGRLAQDHTALARESVRSPTHTLHTAFASHRDLSRQMPGPCGADP